jgi:sugar phosphate isomerase/epimerase
VSQITTHGWPFERDVASVAASGAPAIGVSIRKLELVGIDRARRLIREAGLAVSCLTSSGPFPVLDPAGLRAACATARRHVEAAAALEASCLMLLPATGASLSWEEAAAAFRPVLDDLLLLAERLGVRIALEPVSALRADLGFLHGFDEALDFVDTMGASALGVVLEVNNAWVERRLYANLAERTDRIALVQVNDRRLEATTASDRVVMGDGVIPLRRILQTLARAGYDGWYDIELLGPAIEAEGYEAVVPRAVARFRELWT